MAKEKEQKYNKSAFVDAAADSKERLILRIVLEDGKTYANDEVAEKVKAWKIKEVKA